MNRITNTITPFTTVIRLLGVVQNPANGFPARPLGPMSATVEATTTTALIIEDDEPLVSNLKNRDPSTEITVEDTGGRKHRPEQAFRTGRNPGGYTISEIQVPIKLVGGTEHGAYVLIDRDVNGKPGISSGLFATVVDFAAGSTARFTSSNPVTLDPNTKYWLTLEMGSLSTGNYAVFGSDNSIDPCGELDWNIDSGSYDLVYETLSDVERNRVSNSFQVAIVGAPVDNGSVSETKCDDTNATTTDSFTLASNLDTTRTGFAARQDIVGNSGGKREAGTSITTGSHAAGYTANTVKVAVYNGLDRSNLIPKLKIHSDNNGEPGNTVVGTLTSTTTSLAETDRILELTGSVTIQPNTKYWLMFADDSTNSSAFYYLDSNTNEFYQGSSCGESGFSIGSQRYVRESGTLFSRNKGPLSFAITGSPVGGTTVTCQTPDTVRVKSKAYISDGKTAVGSFQSDNDADWFFVNVENGTEYQLDMFTGINGGGGTVGSVYDIALYNNAGQLQDVDLMEVDPSIGVSPYGPTDIYYEKRRAYFTATSDTPYNLKVTLKGSAYRHGTPSQFPTYTVRVRKADDYAAAADTHGGVSPADSIRGHFFTEHGSSGPDVDWILLNDLVADQTYTLTLTGHATANTQMRIIGVSDPNDNDNKIVNGADAHESSNSVSVQFTPGDGEGYFVGISSGW